MKLILTGRDRLRWRRSPQTRFSVDCDQARRLLGVAKNGSDTRLLGNRAIVAWPAETPR